MFVGRGAPVGDWITIIGAHHRSGRLYDRSVDLRGGREEVIWVWQMFVLTRRYKISSVVHQDSGVPEGGYFTAC